MELQLPSVLSRNSVPRPACVQDTTRTIPCGDCGDMGAISITAPIVLRVSVDCIGIVGPEADMNDARSSRGLIAPAGDLDAETQERYCDRSHTSQQHDFANPWRVWPVESVPRCLRRARETSVDEKNGADDRI